jgi:hypothetical protein
VTRVSTYRLDSYGPPDEIAAPMGGLFQLSDDSWRLVFAVPDAGVSCGLLRSRVEVAETNRRRRCRVTVAEDGANGLHSTFVVRARARDVRDDLCGRFASLDRAADLVAAVEAGEWWKGSGAFDALGWSGTASIAGVRSVGGSWGASRITRTRRARVLDFGPEGVSLRGWRTRLVFPWVSIATIEVTDAQGYARGPKHRRSSGGAVIVLTCHSGEQVGFHAALLTPSETRAELRVPIDNTITPPGKAAQLSSPGSRAIGPAPVPELPLDDHLVWRRSAV